MTVPLKHQTIENPDAGIGTGAGGGPAGRPGVFSPCPRHGTGPLGRSGLGAASVIIVLLVFLFFVRKTGLPLSALRQAVESGTTGEAYRRTFRRGANDDGNRLAGSIETRAAPSADAGGKDKNKRLRHIGGGKSPA